MSLTVGELFVSLGVKGSEKTIGAITSVKNGLKETASTSLEAKAAIVGAMYALERLFATSGAMGTNLTNFNALTGLSAKQLQQWQYAARQAGVSNEEFASSLKTVQAGMTNMLLGKGAPEGLALLATKVGFDPKRARDTFYVMEQLQKFAKTAPADVGNAVLKSFGVSEGIIAAMRRGTFNTQNFKAAPTYSDKEIDKLNRANIAWSNLGVKIEMAFGRFNTRHGGQLVKDISHLTDQVLKLVEAFTKLSEKLKVFEFLGKIFEGWSTIFEGASSGVDSITGALNDPKKKKELGQNVLGFFKEMPSVFGAMLDDMMGSEGKENLNKMIYGGTPLYKPLEEPKPKVNKMLPTGSQQNININQNLHFQHEGKDHKKTGESVKKANQDAFRQFNQGQVS